MFTFLNLDLMVLLWFNFSQWDVSGRFQNSLYKQLQQHCMLSLIRSNAVAKFLWNSAGLTNKAQLLQSVASHCKTAAALMLHLLLFQDRLCNLMCAECLGAEWKCFVHSFGSTILRKALRKWRWSTASGVDHDPAGQQGDYCRVRLWML